MGEIPFDSAVGQKENEQRKIESRRLEDIQGGVRTDPEKEDQGGKLNQQRGGNGKGGQRPSPQSSYGGKRVQRNDLTWRSSEL